MRWYVADVVPVVFVGGSDIKPIYTMVVEGGALVWGLIHDYFTPGWSKGISVVVEIAMDNGVSGDSWL